MVRRGAVLLYRLRLFSRRTAFEAHAGPAALSPGNRVFAERDRAPAVDRSQQVRRSSGDLARFVIETDRAGRGHVRRLFRTDLRRLPWSGGNPTVLLVWRLVAASVGNRGALAPPANRTPACIDRARP